jgi:5-methylcytosine-specific restriction enzyme subunit McrC
VTAAAPSAGADLGADAGAVELNEYAPARSVPLPDAVGRAVAASRVLQSATPDPDRPGHWLLRAGNKVGAVTLRTPDGTAITVRILPKMPVARLFFLLGYSRAPGRAWRAEQVDTGARPGVLPALAHAVERQIDAALRQGLLQGYRTREESSLVVRGRIREAQQLRRHFGSPLPVEIAYDEFTTDIAENRLLRAAVERLLKVPGVPADVRRRLLRQRARLADVTPAVCGTALPRWRPTRLNARYHQALPLAEAVLRGTSPEHVPGELRLDGFLFDMNQLFEDFVTGALGEAARTAGLTPRLQDPHHLDEAAALRIRPDLVLHRAGRAVAVVDAKYKAERHDGYPEADLYQMLAYCTALGLPEGHLVYAKGNAPHTTHRVRHAGILLHQHALDLDQDPAGLLADVAALAGRIHPPA